METLRYQLIIQISSQIHYYKTIIITKQRLGYHKFEQSIHSNPLSTALLQISIHNTLDRAEPRSVVLCKSLDVFLGSSRFFIGHRPGLVHVPQTRKVKQLVVHLLLSVLVRHATQTTLCAAARAQATMTVDTHLSSTVAAGRVIADQPTFVVSSRLGADLAFHLCHNRNN